MSESNFENTPIADLFRFPEDTRIPDSLTEEEARRIVDWCTHNKDLMGKMRITRLENRRLLDAQLILHQNDGQTYKGKTN